MLKDQISYNMKDKTAAQFFNKLRKYYQYVIN